MSGISVPTRAALSPSERVPPTHPSVVRILFRLSRPALISMILDWLDVRNQADASPYLAGDNGAEEDEADLYPPAQSLDELREYYSELSSQKGSKREVVDRVLEGDWRNGISFYQLAMADLQYLYDHPSSQKWTAHKLMPLLLEDDSALEHQELKALPRFHPLVFLQNLQNEVLPDVKAHYNFDKVPGLPVTILRIFYLESPYKTTLSVSGAALQTDSGISRTIYVAFPDASPHVYISMAANNSPAGEVTRAQTLSLRALLLNGIAKAFSKPRHRFMLSSTNFSSRTLEAIIDRRGAGRTNAAGGGWGVYAEQRKGDTPLNTQLATPSGSGDEVAEQEETLPGTSRLIGLKRKRDMGPETVQKRRNRVARARFGNSGKFEDGKGIERIDIRLEDVFPTHNSLGGNEDDAAQQDDSGWTPEIRITFHGTHIFAGVRELVEAGVVNGEQMPGWMTGEEGVSIGVVRDGKIRGNKGSLL